MTGVNRAVWAASPEEKKDSLSSPKETSKRLERHRIKGAKFLRERKGGIFSAEKASKKRGTQQMIGFRPIDSEKGLGMIRIRLINRRKPRMISRKLINRRKPGMISTRLINRKEQGIISTRLIKLERAKNYKYKT